MLKKIYISKDKRKQFDPQSTILHQGLTTDVKRINKMTKKQHSLICLAPREPKS